MQPRNEQLHTGVHTSHVDGLVQDCSNSIANALELLQSCAKPSMWWSVIKSLAGWGVWRIVYKHIEAEQNGRHFADGIFKCIFLNENVWFPIKISLKFVPYGMINNII